MDRFVVASLCAQYAVRIASLRQLIAERMGSCVGSRNLGNAL